MSFKFYNLYKTARNKQNQQLTKNNPYMYNKSNS